MFNKRLREAREKHGFSQVEMAAKIGISKDLYNKYEKTSVRPSHETICVIADILGVTVDYLFGREEQKKISPSKNDELKERLDALMADMSKEDLQKMVDYAELFEAARRNQSKK